MGRNKDHVAINTSKNTTKAACDNSQQDGCLPLISHVSTSEKTTSTPPPRTAAKKSFTSTAELEADIERDMRRYRLKNIFCQSCSVFCLSSWRRFPSDRSVYLALFLCFLERLAYYSATGNLIQPFIDNVYPTISPAVRSLLLSIFMDMMAQLLFPLLGWIADAWVGRYNMLRFSMWFLWLAYGLITLLFTVDGLDYRIIWNKYLLPVWMILINIGSAGFQANVVSFGADQILYGTSDQISSFFYWYYWMRNAGAIFLFLSLDCSTRSIRWKLFVIFGLISTASMSLALVFDSLLSKRWFFIDNNKRNPLWKIIKIFFAATKAERPKRRSAFSFSNLPAPTRMDLTKRVHGGKFEGEEVENAKTVGRILTVLLAVSGALIVYRGVSKA